MKDKIKDLISSDEFRTRAVHFFRSYSNHISQKKLGELISKEQLLEIIGKIDPRDFNTAHYKKHGRILVNLIEDELMKRNSELEAIITSDSEKAIKDLLAEPVTLPHDTVRAFMSQEAIQQLFVTIITDSIIGFNKKINPLAGLTSALGMEAQIKNFLTPFMGNILDSASDFVVSEQNQKLFTVMAVEVFDIIKKEEPKPYIEAVTDVQKDKIDHLSATLSTDATLIEFVRGVSLEVADKYYDQIKDVTVRETFEIDPDQFSDKFAEISIALLIPLMQEDIALDFLLGEVREILN